MKSRTGKLLVVWNVVLTTLVLILLGLYASAAQAANDPPVQVFQANQDHAGGKGTATDGRIEVKTHGEWTVIQKLTLDLSGNHNHECAVVANARIFNAPGNSEDNKYELVLTLDNPDPQIELPTTRFIDFDNGRWVWDYDDQSITSANLYHMTNEAHTLYWLARKISENANPPSYMNVQNSTLWAMCVKKKLL